MRANTSKCPSRFIVSRHFSAKTMKNLFGPHSREKPFGYASRAHLSGLIAVVSVMIPPRSVNLIQFNIWYAVDNVHKLAPVYHFKMWQCGPSCVMFRWKFCMMYHVPVPTKKFTGNKMKCQKITTNLPMKTDFTPKNANWTEHWVSI